MKDFQGKAHYPIDLAALPTGWAAAFVGAVCSDLQSGFASGEHNSHGTGVPHLRPMNVDRQGRLDRSAIKYVAEDTDARRLRSGDVLFNNTNSPVLVGKTAPVTASDELAFSNHMTRLRPATDVNYRFLAHHLHFLWMSGYFGRRCNNHVNQASISADTLASTVPLAIAPTAEQERIAEAIDSYVSRLDAAGVSLERARARLARYRASVLKAAVEGRLVPTEADVARVERRGYEPAEILVKRILVERRRRWEEAERAKLEAIGQATIDDRWKAKYSEPQTPDTNGLPKLPEGWCWATVGQLSDVTGGLTKNTARDRLLKKLPYLRVANVYANSLQLDEIKEIGVDDNELRRAVVQRGDLLIVEGNGSIDQIGRVALWDGSIAPIVHQNHLIKARFVIPPTERWALTWLLSPSGRRMIEHVASSTSGLHTLSISKVERLPVAFPPIDEQERVLQSIDEASSILEASTVAVGHNQGRCNRLRQSILKWGFEGKLVNQDPNDDHACALLDRIRTGRAAPNSARSYRAREVRAGT